MRRLLLLLAAAAVLGVPATATAATPRPFVYVVVMDGLDGDRVDAGEAPFVSSLLAGQGAHAAYYRESRSAMVAETNPNHTAMVTGAYPTRSGVYANGFAVYHPLENDDSCRPTGPRDVTKPPHETSGENANCIQAETIFAAIRKQGNPDGLVTAGIFGKPKLAKLFDTRQASAPRRDLDYIWAPCTPDEARTDYCESVPSVPRYGYAFLDSQPMDAVLRSIRDGVPVPGAARRRPDLTFVNLPEIDNAGHVFSTATGAYTQAISDSDAQIKRLVDELRARGEWSRSVLVLLSDHSMETTLTKTSMDDAFPAAGIPKSDFMAIGKSGVDLIYLTNRASPSRFDKLKRMRAAALATGNVSEALYREPNPLDGGSANTLDGRHPEWHAAGERGPDLFLTHRPGGSFSDPDPDDQPLPGHHGAPQTRDNFFAVIGGAEHVVRQDRAGTRAPDFDDTAANPRQAENVDVAATVMGLFGLAAPAQDQGRFLGEAFDGRRLPGHAAPARPGLSVRKGRGYRYRATFTGGAVFDLDVRRGKRVFRRVSQVRTSAVAFPRPRGRRLRLYLRTTAASGVRSYPAAMTVGPPRRRR
ncbi:MAG TPA: alkaline phosphatase family protein [Solirubrobacteraceae bacterium]|nr:alkaline phosphatase family protein [Solirubrobacteraceae bacterium]